MLYFLKLFFTTIIFWLLFRFYIYISIKVCIGLNVMNEINIDSVSMIIALISLLLTLWTFKICTWYFKGMQEQKK